MKMSGRFWWLGLGIVLTVAAGCASAPSGAPSILSPGVHPYVLQSNAPSPWQTEPDIIPIVGSDGKSIWGLANSPFGALRLDLATNTTQDFPISEQVAAVHAGLGGTFIFCGSGHVGIVSATGAVTYLSEPIGRCWGITTGPDSNYWLVETQSVDRITPTGQLSTFAIPTVTGLDGIVSSAKDGVLWFDWYTQSQGGTETGVGTINPSSGNYSLFPVSAQLGPGGAGLNTGVDGNMYFVPAGDHRSTGEIVRISPNGKVTRFTNLPINLGFNDSAENVSTIWFGGLDDHLYGWSTTSHVVKDKGLSPFEVRYPILGPDMNVWFEDGAYLQRLLNTSPQSAALGVGGQQLFTISETDCSQCVWTAVSSNPGIASVSPVSSGAFTVTGVASGSATITVSDKRFNAVQVPITVD